MSRSATGAGSARRRLPAVPRGCNPGQNDAMSAEEVDQYLDSLPEPKRTTLRQLRATILETLPDAEQVISYRLPAFRVRGKVIAGFGAFKNHLSYLPHSGSVFPALTTELAGYSMSTGALRFDIGTPLPRELVERLLAVRLAQAFGDSGSASGSNGRPVER